MTGVQTCALPISVKVKKEAVKIKAEQAKEVAELQKINKAEKAEEFKKAEVVKATSAPSALAVKKVKRYTSLWNMTRDFIGKNATNTEIMRAAKRVAADNYICVKEWRMLTNCNRNSRSLTPNILQGLKVDSLFGR